MNLRLSGLLTASISLRCTVASALLLCLTLFSVSSAIAADDGKSTDSADVAAPAHSNWFMNVDDAGLAIGGFDPVSYFHEDGPVRGAVEHSFRHGSVHYRFQNAANQETFEADPEKYVPAFGGWCAFMMSRTVDHHGAVPRRFPPDPTHFTIHDGRLYLFVRASNVDTKEIWLADADRRVSNAQKFWDTRLAIGRRFPSKPAGLNRLAIMETLQFDFLIGQWNSDYTVRVSQDTEATANVKGAWKAWYGWDGFAVYDDWKQVGIPGGNSGPAIRSFDPRNQQWVMHYIPINAPMNSVWPMTAKADKNGQLHGEMNVKDGQGKPFLQRIHFVDIQRDSFTWRSDRSYDDGKTWIENWGVSRNVRVVDPAE